MGKKAKHCWALSTNFSVQLIVFLDHVLLLTELEKKIKSFQNSCMVKGFHETELRGIYLYKLSQKSTDLMDPPIAYCFTFCEYRYFFATLYTANDYDEQKHDNVIEACSRRRRVLSIWVV